MLKRVFTALLLISFILSGLYLWLILPLNWQTVSSKETPGGKWIAYHLQSGSEAGEAPYGDHIVLASSYWPLGQYYGEVVFAGYCGNSLGYQWLDTHQLQLDCVGEKVMKRPDTFKGVQIKYQIVDKAPHNKPPQLTQ